MPKIACNAELAPKIVLLLLLVTLVICGALTLDSDRLEALLTWMEEEPVQGSIFFVALYVVAVTVLFPGSILALAAGAVFGLVLGSLLVWMGTVLGQTLAFMIGRYLLRDLVVDYTLKKYPSWAAVDTAVSREGWKLITLLRLSPIVPWNMLNYALSVTGVGFWQYAVSSAVAVLPWNVTFAYFGSLAHTMADVIDGNTGPGTRTSIVFLGISGVMLAVAVTYTTIIAKRAIREALDDGPSQDIADNLDTLNLLSAPSQNFSQDIEMAAAYCSPRGLSSNSTLQAVSPRDSNRVLERRASIAAVSRHPNERIPVNTSTQASN